MSSLPNDPYKALGVSKDAQLPEIRSAHRKLVLKCHPDKVQDPKLKEEKQREFQQVQQAYELLSNEAERARYDDKVKLEELRKEARGMASTTTSSPRTSKRHETRYYDVREAEPRSTTFSTSPHNVYGHTPPSRSWDENLYGRGFDEKPRSARKTASYEYDRERSRKDEDRRRREEDKEWIRQHEKVKEREREERHREREAMKEREREREKEKEREAVKKDKDRRKDERKEDKKKAEKDRRKESDDKHRRHKSPYMETFPGDETEEAVYTTSSSSKPEKKKSSSSSKKYDETPPPAAAAPPPPREAGHPPPTTDRERKNSANLDNAIRYLSRSGAKPPALSRAQTYHAEFAGVRHVAPIAVPTPPPAAASAFAPPPMADPRDAPLDGDVKRSSARPRRMSHDTPRSKEKSHKKSSSSKEAIIVDASPSSGARIVPSFTKSHSIPISGQSESHRMPPLSRSTTESYPRPQPPGLERASTWMPESDLGRERSRSRHARTYTDDSSEDDRDRERRHRRSRRTQSPEDIPEDIPVQTTRYTVSSSTRKAIPVPPMPNSSARRAAEPRNAYYEHEDFEEDTPGYFPSGVKYSKQFGPGEIQFSNLPHVREELFA
ncbi:DnaJ-domain-containing protein [Annulohypoxylon maeteangense]|uniref:DnaJ-domain-containing protein n=1 Tax=Annulohypoxylon maeteangense TaxID=1927788 RepID=UPI00200795C3|nr:DnaJ-domain-containing protein [Annulohypoxylon maeteangense]KAI0884061.1 DnaJ-domain-containing protein [Annulohypoxylon maeteangense]